jgi:hypothetical protein
MRSRAPRGQDGGGGASDGLDETSGGRGGLVFALPRLVIRDGGFLQREGRTHGLVLIPAPGPGPGGWFSNYAFLAHQATDRDLYLKFNRLR